MKDRPGVMSASALNAATAAIITQLLLLLQRNGSECDAPDTERRRGQVALSMSEIDALMEAALTSLGGLRQTTEDNARRQIEIVWDQLRADR